MRSAIDADSIDSMAAGECAARRPSPRGLEMRDYSTDGPVGALCFYADSRHLDIRRAKFVVLFVHRAKPVFTRCEHQDTDGISCSKRN
jgi:hypothetical protein